LGKDEYEITNGNTMLSAGDHLVLITQAEFSQKVLEFFGNTID
jgi:Trk K+ transport system NAD-binding subunit